MRHFIAIVASALGGVAALIVFISVFGLLEIFFRDGTLFGLILPAVFGSATGFALAIFGSRTADLVAGIKASLSLALFFSIPIILVVAISGAIRSSAEVPEFMLMILVYLASFGTLPGLVWCLAMACFSEKR